MANTMKLSDALSKDELTSLREKSDLRALASLVWTWGLIAGAFAIAIVWTNPLTILLGILILGGRQLALGVMNHDCSHHAFFRSPKVDEFVGHWLCGAPINTSLQAYRAYHLKHHKFAGTPDDPDTGFVKDYPVLVESLRRKFVRDLTGQTGYRDTLRKIRNFKLSRNWPWLTFHVLLLGTLTLAGAPWAYLMWWAAELTVYPAIVRLRQIGEHGTAKDRTSLEPRLNTGTTVAPIWQRVFIAPNDVNYHLEHHMFATIPPYNLGRLHRLLASRGYYDGYDCISRGYDDVIRRAVRPDAARMVAAE
ncbi:MAG: fatty acid desaturase [Hyphomonas sp.]|uniref:fatty acid desaturase family protein n=1 Tax=Hyphomonas sp. TaxID=87 RepID=UPI0018074712|nr:fatty acid desaturase family protein [Hyphomonas sp.]MBA3069088.1 fatty acid desaturase [Hyphomonas sp.]MBU3921052.1 fatty acid desaturase family protein [Alphaproteobacteria bacterium]MBU4063561.1 fatty acid desaturase family protein [Alphaproteobacteria bacterium]MBU4165052.1 fatty acid desaturase family protein [Alphaproteobacteria bacterium]